MQPTRYLILAAMIPLLAAAQDKKKPPARPAPPAAGTAIPKEAKQIEPYTWRHTDRQGQNWIYRKTPFGVVRYPEPASADKPAEVIPEGMSAVEEGDLVRFERPSPFGKYRWTRKKSELTELEQKVWERDRLKGAPAKSHPQE
jgi:hypothetical protein